MKQFIVQPNGKKGEDAIDVLVSQISSDKMAALTQRLEALPFVRHVNVVRRTMMSRSEESDSAKLSAP